MGGFDFYIFNFLAKRKGVASVNNKKKMEQLIKAALIPEEQCIKLEKKFGIDLSGEEGEESYRQIFEDIIRHHMKQQLLAAQVHAALEDCQSPRKKIIRAERIKAAKRNKLL